METMTLFEFLMMIAAVATAVGITEIVGGWGRWLRTPVTHLADWLHMSWSITVLLWLIFYWIGMWSYSVLPITYVGQVMFLIIPTLFGVLAAYAVMPSETPTEASFDSRTHYLTRRRCIFIPLALFAAMSVVADVVIVGAGKVMMEPILLLGLLLPTVVFLILASTERIWVHIAGLAVTLATLLPFLFERTENIASRWLP